MAISSYDTGLQHNYTQKLSSAQYTVSQRNYAKFIFAISNARWYRSIFWQSFTRREVHIKSDKSLTTQEQATASMHSETATRFPCHCILAKHNKIWTHLLVSSTEAQQICSVYGTSTNWNKVSYINEMQTGLELAHTTLAAFIDAN